MLMINDNRFAAAKGYRTRTRPRPQYCLSWPCNAMGESLLVTRNQALSGSGSVLCSMMTVIQQRTSLLDHDTIIQVSDESGR